MVGSWIVRSTWSVLPRSAGPKVNVPVEGMGNSIFEFISIRLLTPNVTQLECLSATNRIYPVLKSAGLGAAVSAYSPIATNILSTLPLRGNLPDDRTR